MDPHVHISPVHLLAALAIGIAVYGTLHLLAITFDNRAARAWLALGF
jgi:hypothetical protein